MRSKSYILNLNLTEEERKLFYAMLIYDIKDFDISLL